MTGDPRDDASLARLAANGSASASHGDRERMHVTTELLSGFFDASPAGIVVVDTAMHVLLWNPAMERILGWSAGDVIGRPYPAVAADGTIPAVSILAETLEAGPVVGREVARLRKDRSKVQLRVSTAPLHAPDGRPTGAIVLVEDVTERRELEEQLRQAQKMDAIGRLAGGVAHDFNNLLTAIGGHIHLVLEALPHDSSVRDDAEEVRRAAERAADLTRQLLAFGRKQFLQPRPIDAGRVVAGLQRMLARLIGDDIELRTELPDHALPIVADPGQIEQVIVNLAVNARDAMPGGGAILIAAREEDEAAAPPPPGSAAPPRGRYVAIEVRDDGAGMDAATAARVFEPFFTTKPPGKGTGLGLSTAYGIVSQSGGWIDVRSEPGRGTKMTIRLPRADGDVAPDDAAPQVASAAPLSASAAPLSASAAPRRASAGAPPDGPARTILLVEDDAAVRSLCARTLGRFGYAVIAAPGAAEALAIVDAKADIDLVLTDVTMPGISGLDLADRLRERLPGLPILFMSGHNEEILHDRSIDLRDFLAKPFIPALLIHRVQERLGEA